MIHIRLPRYGECGLRIAEIEFAGTLLITQEVPFRYC